MNGYVATNTLNGFLLGDYLYANLGFQKGTDERITKQTIIETTTMTVTGPVTGTATQTATKYVYEWLQDGGRYEDLPPATMPYFRSVNHFHNPLKSLDQAGFTGIWGSGLLHGKSAILWSQSSEQTQSPGGYYSWHDVRNYYYHALISPDNNVRNTNFADTFRGLGQLMHLVQDMSVPEHARDDGHYVGDFYEEYVKSKPNLVTSATTTPIFFSMTALSQPSAFGIDAPVPIANLFDTKRYNATRNPAVTMEDNIGLSEYTSANFVSTGTINSGGLFPYPIVSDSPTSSVTKTTRDIPDPFHAGSTIKRNYHWKERHGDMGYLLAGVGYLWFYADNNNIKH